MLIYSALLTLGLVLSSPWWLVRIATTRRYREGMRQRLGAVPAVLRGGLEAKRVVWVHAVSVGEVLAASRLVGELEAALGDGFRVVVSTTTRTGQALARERFGDERVFYMPLDFGFTVRAYLDALNPAALILMESELWPRMLYECARRGIPVAVVNARMSDRSFKRAMRMRSLWGGIMRRPALWLAQSEGDALRLVLVGVRAELVKVVGNLKYDVRAPMQRRVAERFRRSAAGRKILVAGSTVGDRKNSEDRIFLDAVMRPVWQMDPEALLVLAPRHPERFDEVVDLAEGFAPTVRATTLLQRSEDVPLTEGVVILDTIGDLAAVYGVADVAFVGGSLLPKGGHNPLEPAQFGVPVVMGPAFENFRDIVAKMQEAGGIAIVKDGAQCRDVFLNLLVGGLSSREMGERGRCVFEEQQGATARAVEALVVMIQGASR